jgi:hypothetical protein
MSESDQAIIARMSSDFAAMSAYLGRASADLRQLERALAERPLAPVPWQPSTAVPAPWPQQASPPFPRMPRPRSDGWVGKALAVAGVVVTLVGVALLLVLAAQAGVLRPEVRVAAGAALAFGLVAAAGRLQQRRGGRVGAIAVAAAGVAIVYLDVIAITTVYHWVSGPVGLMIAAVVAGAGLLLARRWDAEALGPLMLVPLIGLGPVVADGVTVPLLGFLLALGAISVPVQLGRDWIAWHAARTAVCTLPLLFALVVSGFGGENSPLLAVACGVAGMVAIGGAVILLPHTGNAVAVGLLSAVGTVPVLSAALVADGMVAASMAIVLAAVLLAIVLSGTRGTVLAAPVRTIWSALAAVAALVAVSVAFDGPVAGTVLLALAVVVAAVGRHAEVARWCAMGIGAVGGLCYLAYAPPGTLVTATVPTVPIGASTLISSVLVLAYAALVVRTWPVDGCWAVATVIVLYGVTTFSVTAGMLGGGDEAGFFTGHVVATICWIALAAAALRHAAGVPRTRRSLPIGGGMAVAAAAMIKLFLFDLGTLNGLFRVVVFIVVGLALLGMGAGYARRLAQQVEPGQRTATR